MTGHDNRPLSLQRMQRAGRKPLWVSIRGQTLAEYLIITAAVVLALFIFASPVQLEHHATQQFVKEHYRLGLPAP